MPRFVGARILAALDDDDIANGKTLFGALELGSAVAVEIGDEKPQGYESP